VRRQRVQIAVQGLGQLVTVASLGRVISGGSSTSRAPPSRRSVNRGSARSLVRRRAAGGPVDLLPEGRLAGRRPQPVDIQLVERARQNGCSAR